MSVEQEPKDTKRERKGAKGIPKGAEMGANGERNGSHRVPKGWQREEREPKGHPLRNRNEKVRKRVRRSMQIDAERVPKASQKRCKNISRINAKTGTEKDEEDNENEGSLRCKNMQIHWKGHRI